MHPIFGPLFSKLGRASCHSLPLNKGHGAVTLRLRRGPILSQIVFGARANPIFVGKVLQAKQAPKNIGKKQRLSDLEHNPKVRAEINCFPKHLPYMLALVFWGFPPNMYGFGYLADCPHWGWASSETHRADPIHP